MKYVITPQPDDYVIQTWYAPLKGIAVEAEVWEDPDNEIMMQVISSPFNEQGALWLIPLESLTEYEECQKRKLDLPQLPF